MSATRRTRARDLVAKAATGEKLVFLTSYDAPTAALVEEAGVDLILVGDSAGNVVLGLRETRPVTLDAMIHHTAAVVRGTKTVHVCLDLPFGSYQVSTEGAKRSVVRAIKETGCQSVKVEGGEPWYETIQAIVDMGVPVLGHLGHLPQSNGLHPHRDEWDAVLRETLVASALGLEQAGCFGVVLEIVPREVARDVSEALSIPTIGIGSGPHCDGQVLVLHDILGIGRKLPHAKRYAELGTAIRDAAAAFAAEVRTGTFPSDEHGFE